VKIWRIYSTKQFQFKRQKSLFSVMSMFSVGVLFWSQRYIFHGYFQNVYQLHNKEGQKANMLQSGPLKDTQNKIFHFFAPFAKNQPKAIVHIGQQSTGDVLSALEYLRENLLEEGYAMPSHIDAPGFYTGLRSMSNIVAYLNGDRLQATETTPLRFKEFLSRNKKEKNSIILSSNDFVNLDPEKLSKLLSPYYDVRIVIVYRRFYDRLFSQYYLKNKDGSKLFETFDQFTNQYNKEENQSLGHIYTTFKEKFDDVHVLESVTGSDISEAFFCDRVITNARETCTIVKDFYESMISTPGNGQYLEYKRLALIAKSQNILDESVDIDIAMKALWKASLDDSRKAPKICDHEVARNMERQAITEESLLFPEWSMSNLRTDFNLFKTNLCNLDVEKMLKEVPWLNFMKRLNELHGKDN